MKAWGFTGPQQPLRVVERPPPVAGAGEVVIDVKAAGLCHSDVGILEGPGAAWLRHTPIILGHEVAGIISSIGAGVCDFRVGDRVAINPMFGVGKDPSDGNAPGTGRDGGYAQRILAYPAELVRIPDRVSFQQAAPVTDAGMTSWHAIRVAGAARNGTRLGIVGLGGLGLIGARAAVLAGAEVYGVDLKTELFPLARELGVQQCFTKVGALAPLELDLIVDFAGMGSTTADAVAAVGYHQGRVVLVGLGREQATIPTFALALKQVQLIGSCGGTSQDISELFAMIDGGKLEISATSIAFDEIGEGLGRLQRGEVQGRLVALL